MNTSGQLLLDVDILKEIPFSFIKTKKQTVTFSQCYEQILFIFLNFRSNVFEGMFSGDFFRKKQQIDTLSTSQTESTLDYNIHLNSQTALLLNEKT